MAERVGFDEYEHTGSIISLLTTHIFVLLRLQRPVAPHAVPPPPILRGVQYRTVRQLVAQQFLVHSKNTENEEAVERKEGIREIEGVEEMEVMEEMKGREGREE